jgi:hypothetical protein
VLDRPSASLRECANPFGGPSAHVTEDWRRVDHAVIGDDPASDEVWPDDPYLLGTIVWARIGIH